MELEPPVPGALKGGVLFTFYWMEGKKVVTIKRCVNTVEFYEKSAFDSIIESTAKMFGGFTNDHHVIKYRVGNLLVELCEEDTSMVFFRDHYNDPVEIFIFNGKGNPKVNFRYEIEGLPPVP